VLGDGRGRRAARQLEYRLRRVYVDQPKLAQAETAARSAIAQAHTLKAPGFEALAQSVLAEIERRRARPVEAAHAVEQARALAQAQPDPEVPTVVAIQAARVALTSSSLRESARRELEHALNQARQNRLDLRDGQLTLGELDWAAGRRHAAREALTALPAEARASGDLVVAREADATLGARRDP
jgi:hypothetical protein